MEIVKNRDGSIRFKEKVYLSNGHTETRTFSRKTDALAWKRQKQLERDRNEVLGIPSLNENVEFGTIIDKWLRLKILPLKSPKTAADYQSVVKKHLRPRFGRLPIRSIDRKHADQLIESLKTSGLENKTLNKILMVLKQILRFAEIQGYLFKTPLAGYSFLREKKGRIDYLSKQEVLQLLRSNSLEAEYPILVVALNTGMRIGELTGLCWDRINFENDTIEVSRTMTRAGLKESTKTNLVRYIPMNFEVKATLQSLMRNQTGPRFVFADKNGHPYNPDHYTARHLRKALDRAGVRSIGFHTLRHTYASQFMMSGGNIYDLQKILGHTQVSMTMIYAHLSPQHLRRAVDTVRFSAEGNFGSSPFLALQESRPEIKIAP